MTPISNNNPPSPRTPTPIGPSRLHFEEELQSMTSEEAATLNKPLRQKKFHTLIPRKLTNLVHRITDQSKAIMGHIKTYSPSKTPSPTTVGNLRIRFIRDGNTIPFNAEDLEEPENNITMNVHKGIDKKGQKFASLYPIETPLNGSNEVSTYAGKAIVAATKDFVNSPTDKGPNKKSILNRLN
jgi:hypothetical protein